MRISILLCLAVSSAAYAHDGPRVWIGNSGGTVHTYTSDDDLDPTTYFSSRIFQTTLSPFFGVYTTEFPGYEVRRDGGSVPANTLFGFRMAGPLLMLEPAQNRLRPTMKIFAPAPPQVAVTLSETTTVTNTGVQDAYDFYLFGGVGDHAHLSFTLLGADGSPSAPTPDGVYVLPMMLTASSLARSDWYFLVMDKSGTTAQTTQATTLTHAMETARPGDVNFDGYVNFDDLLTLAQNYGSSSGRWWGDGDFSFDGDVDFDDLLQLAQHYGAGSIVTTSFENDWTLARSIAPEPLAAGMLVIPVVRRRRV